MFGLAAKPPIVKVCISWGCIAKSLAVFQMQMWSSMVLRRSLTSFKFKSVCACVCTMRIFLLGHNDILSRCRYQMSTSLRSFYEEAIVKNFTRLIKSFENFSSLDIFHFAEVGIILFLFCSWHEMSNLWDLLIRRQLLQTSSGWSKHFNMLKQLWKVNEYPSMPEIK